MKIWVFSQVSRFSSEPPILIFKSPIQSGGSSSLILEPPPSGVISSRSENPQIDVFHFPLFVLGFIPFLSKTKFIPKSETFLHHLVIRARLVVLTRLVSEFLVCASKNCHGALVCSQLSFVFGVLSSFFVLFSFIIYWWLHVRSLRLVNLAPKFEWVILAHSCSNKQILAQLVMKHI